MIGSMPRLSVCAVPRKRQAPKNDAASRAEGEVQVDLVGDADFGAVGSKLVHR